MIDSKMRLFLPGLALAVLAAWALPGQNDAPASGGFPAQLLDGPEDFDFALQFQGDARGNVGPCG